MKTLRTLKDTRRSRNQQEADLTLNPQNDKQVTTGRTAHRSALPIMCPWSFPVAPLHALWWGFLAHKGTVSSMLSTHLLALFSCACSGFQMWLLEAPSTAQVNTGPCCSTGGQKAQTHWLCSPVPAMAAIWGSWKPARPLWPPWPLKSTNPLFLLYYGHHQLATQCKRTPGSMLCYSALPGDCLLTVHRGQVLYTVPTHSPAPAHRRAHTPLSKSGNANSLTEGRKVVTHYSAGITRRPASPRHEKGQWSPPCLPMGESRSPVKEQEPQLPHRGEKSNNLYHNKNPTPLFHSV
jgi:hypothetical protein